MKKKLYIFVGPPGSGKGSLSQRCVNELGWKQLSTGSLCRVHIKNQTEIGKQIDKAIQAGRLVSDDLIIAMVRDWMEANYEIENIILDGFPRTVGQARALHVFINEKLQDSLLDVVRLGISDATIISRLTGRLICNEGDCQMVYSSLEGSSLASKEAMQCDRCNGPLSRRRDDEPESVKERLSIYHRHEKDLLDFFDEIGQSVKEIDVEQKPEVVFQDFLKIRES